MCTSHCAHAMLHTDSHSRSLVHSTVASLWHAQLCHMEPLCVCLWGAPAWVIAVGTRPMWEFSGEGGGHRASGAGTELGMQRMAWSMGR